MYMYNEYVHVHVQNVYTCTCAITDVRINYTHILYMYMHIAISVHSTCTPHVLYSAHVLSVHCSVFSSTHCRLRRRQAASSTPEVENNGLEEPSVEVIDLNVSSGDARYAVHTG